MQIVIDIDEDLYEGIERRDGALETEYVCNELMKAIDNGTPQQKTGHWIKIQSGDEMFPESIVCSKCKNENSHLDFNKYAEPIGKAFIKSRYCPNCGAKMESEDKE